MISDFDSTHLLQAGNVCSPTWTPEKFPREAVFECFLNQVPFVFLTCFLGQSMTYLVSEPFPFRLSRDDISLWLKMLHTLFCSVQVNELAASERYILESNNMLPGLLLTSTRLYTTLPSVCMSTCTTPRHGY